jgi:DNA-binding NtrC family response regulator
MKNTGDDGARDKERSINSGHPLKVLVVDDEAGFRGFLKLELNRLGIEVETAESGEEAVQWMKKMTFDVVITDITMPRMDGIKLLQEVKRIAPGTEVIVVTGFGAVETAVYAMRQGAFDFVLKPYDLDYLMGCVKKAADGFSKCQSCGKKT